MISQQPFAFTLINLLKDKGVITTGITIPFIIGAYKIAKHDSIEVNLKFIQEVFADIVATAKDTKFFICTCNHINQHVITILTQEDTDVTGHYSTISISKIVMASLSFILKKILISLILH